MPRPNIFSPTSNDPQTLRDAVEAGHEEPETPDEGRCQSGEHIQSDFFMAETMLLLVCIFFFYLYLLWGGFKLRTAWCVMGRTTPSSGSVEFVACPVAAG